MSTTNEHIEFLKTRLTVIEKRIAATEDYKEMKVLKKIISELSGMQQLSLPISDTPIMPVGVPKIERTTGYTKDMQNSPVPHLGHGKRIPYVYNIVEQVVKEHGGELEIDKLQQILRDTHGMD